MVWCKAHFDILNRLGVTHECDRRTDFLLANAALHYYTMWSQKRNAFDTKCYNFYLTVKVNSSRSLKLDFFATPIELPIIQL